ncbi:MAG: glycosidase [Ignavibacteriales bacterium]|nr:glycosidase [Ignavibacteriales bacterium]
MNEKQFNEKLNQLLLEHEKLIKRKNIKIEKSNGVYNRYKYPILTSEHTPLFWRYDLNYISNPYLMERQGINCTFNSGAMIFKGKIVLAVRVEGVDRKSFFAIAESLNGIDNFKFWDYPVKMPQTERPDSNVYDMRLVEHEDGWIYGLFCTERHDDSRPDDTSAAVASCGIARTKDLVEWERLPDLISYTGQQRNVVLHQEFINGKYGLYTRPQDGFIETGSGGGIGWGLTDSMEHPEVKKEIIIDRKVYHTIYEVKNGLGPAPIKTEKGWLHLAHGVRNTAAGLRYVLYLMLADQQYPMNIIHKPAGYFIAPEGDERVGDVSNVTFSNGWVKKPNGEVLIYYASSDTRMHVAVSTIDKLLDYVTNTPEDRFISSECVKTRNELIEKNLTILNKHKKK